MQRSATVTYLLIIAVLVLAVLAEAVSVQRLRSERTELRKTAVQLRREVADLAQRAPHAPDRQFLLRVSRDLGALADELCDQVGAGDGD